MSKRTISVDDRLHAYLLRASLREAAVLERLRAETATLPGAGMQISPEQGQLMALLLKLSGARRVIEIGTFTGYSALVMALALPDDGRIIACDVSEEWTAVARRYWAEAGIAGKIDLRIAPALETVRSLIDDGQAGGFDFVFIDADKENIAAYYEAGLVLLRPGGLIAVDNTLWNGRVADPDVDDASTVAIRAFNARLRDDERVDLSLVPIGDGLSLARRR
ncbi:MAG: class I SAM-dependent methyltransferase [Rhodospirillales bacterium]|nr:class I SAM-dependent methyltransferase [Rhodospirillales bacterium]